MAQLIRIRLTRIMAFRVKCYNCPEPYDWEAGDERKKFKDICLEPQAQISTEWKEYDCRLCGFPEFTDTTAEDEDEWIEASVPPKYYLKKTIVNISITTPQTDYAWCKDETEIDHVTEGEGQVFTWPEIDYTTCDGTSYTDEEHYFTRNTSYSPISTSGQIVTADNSRTSTYTPAVVTPGSQETTCGQPELSDPPGISYDPEEPPAFECGSGEEMVSRDNGAALPAVITGDEDWVIASTTSKTKDTLSTTTYPEGDPQTVATKEYETSASSGAYHCITTADLDGAPATTRTVETEQSETLSDLYTEAEALLKETPTEGEETDTSTPKSSLWEQRTDTEFFTVRTVKFTIKFYNLTLGRSYKGCVRMWRRKAFNGTIPLVDPDDPESEEVSTDWEEVEPFTFGPFTANNGNTETLDPPIGGLGFTGRTLTTITETTNQDMPGGTEDARGWEYQFADLAGGVPIWPADAPCDCPNAPVGWSPGV